MEVELFADEQTAAIQSLVEENPYEKVMFSTRTLQKSYLPNIHFTSAFALQGVLGLSWNFLAQTDQLPG